MIRAVEEALWLVCLPTPTTEVDNSQKWYINQCCPVLTSCFVYKPCCCCHIYKLGVTDSQDTSEMSGGGEEDVLYFELLFSVL